MDTRPEYDILDLKEKPGKIWPTNDHAYGPWIIDWNPKFRIMPDMHIASMGSCFALQIGEWLKRSNYNYVESEVALDGSGPWGKVYTPAAAWQILAYSTGKYEPAELPWEVGDYLLDPMRKWIKYHTMPQFEMGRKYLQRETRKVVKEADVFVLTLGLNELWGNHHGDVFYQVPPRTIFDPDLHTFWTASAFDVDQYLEGFVRELRSINPWIRIILTLSPVPLRATFRDDVDVVTANTESKALLRTVITDFVKSTDGVDYFPSFEIAFAHQGWPFIADNRHVRPQVVGEIMRQFEQKYILDSGVPTV